MIYNIPGDTGVSWRFDKFEEYLIEFPDEVKGMAQDFLESYPKSGDLNDTVWLIFLYSCCYSYPSSFVLYNLIDYREHYEDFELEFIWRTNKPKLIFQSDRRYVKYMDEFVPMVKDFLSRTKGKPWDYINQFYDPNDIPGSYTRVYKEVNTWHYFGRFGVGLFIYNLWKLTPMILDHPEYDWKNGATTTAAFFIMMYNDIRAEQFGKKKNQKGAPSLSKYELDALNNLLELTLNHFRANYPDRMFSTLQVTADSCSYYKMYKGARYQGYYVDRQWEEIIHLYKEYPKLNKVWELCWQARRKYIPHKYLGELNGWKGIRKEKFTEFLTTGIV